VPPDNRHDHTQARGEHQAWKDDLDRWRRELVEAVLDYVRQNRPDLALVDFEKALASHDSALEIGVEIHEQALARHERALGVERRGMPGASEGFEEIHLQLESRHANAKKAHEDLARWHRAIIEALKSNDPL